MIRAQIVKNLRLLLHSRTSAIVLVLGPLLLVALAGVSLYSSSDIQLTIGLLSDGFDEDPRINALKGQLEQRFTVLDFASKENCINRMYSGTVQACIFSQEGVDNTVAVSVFIDPSQVSTAESVAGALSSAINNQSVTLSTALTQTLLGRVTNVTQTLYGLQSNILVRAQDDTNQTIQLIFSGTNDASNLRALNNQNFDSSITSADISQARDDQRRALSLLFDAIDEAEDALEDARGSAADAGTQATLDEGLDALQDIQDDIEQYVRSANDNDWAGAQLATYAQTLQDETIGLAVQMQQAGAQGSRVTTSLQQAGERLENVSTSLDTIQARIDSSLVLLQGASSLNAGQVASPYRIAQIPIAQATSRIFFMAPGLLVSLVLLSCIALATTCVQIEKKTPARFRNFAAPVSNASTFLALQLTVLLVVSLQIMIMLAALFAVFPQSPINGIFSTLFVLLIIALVFTTIGMINGYLFSTEQNAIIGALTISGILLIFSDVVVAIELFPLALQQIIEWSPFVIASDLVREVLVLGSTPTYPRILALAGYFITSTLVVFGAMKIYRIISLVYMQKITNRFK